MTSKPKAHTRQDQAAETRRKLLASAKKQFAEKGYANTPVRSINREIEMADGLLYHYFPGGKREILQVMIQECCEKANASIEAYAKDLDSLPLEEALEHVYLVGDEIFSQDLDLIKIIIRDYQAIGLDKAEGLSSLLKERQCWMIDFLKDRHAKGEIREMDFEMATEHLLASSIRHAVSKITNIDTGQGDDAQRRKRVLAYIVSLWKTPEKDEKEK